MERHTSVFPNRRRRHIHVTSTALVARALSDVVAGQLERGEESILHLVDLVNGKFLSGCII